MSLPKLLAGVVASLIMSLIWYLASPRDAQPHSAADLAALRTPVTLTLLSGRQVSGEVQGVDSLCADWLSALRASPDTVVTLPDGSAVTGADVRTFVTGRNGLEGVEGLSKVSACPATLTVHAVGSPAESSAGPSAGLGELKGAVGSAASMKTELKSLTDP
ncbi:hypothetical protein Q0M94_09855 [Deinococcus radiomollis]|uniref:hypothetical protein n=1 Tax=Deinococcus radiomollis TaxID=468916 RepID=UPI003892B18E